MTTAVNQIVPPTADGAPRVPFAARPRVWRWGILIAIVWLALFLRVWQLDTLPPGLHYDEAFNGMMARDVLRGVQRPIFFTDNFGEEPLHIYTEALLFAALGERAWTIRLVSALFGVVLSVALYATARAFFPRSARVALGSAFIGATLYWAINFSRIGIETNGLPMLLTLSAAALGFGYRRMRWKWVAGAGFLMSATVYTYLAARLWLPTIFLWFLWLCIFRRARVRAHFSKWLVLAVVALLALAPLALFFLANPVALGGRSDTVFTPETFGVNLARTAGMFFFNGDADPRDNLPGRPALDVILAAFFSIGLLVALARFRKPFYAFVLLWFVVMSLPSALTEFAPNFRRAIGAMPATILLCALGVEWTWTRIANFRVRISNFNFQYIGYGCLISLLAWSAFWNGHAYFVEWASGTGLFYSFDAGLLRVAENLAARPREEQLCLTPNYAEHYTVRWALDGRAVAAFDGRRVLVLPDSSRAVTCGIITYEDAVTRAALERAFAPTKAPPEILDANGQPYAVLLSFPPNTRVEIEPPHPLALDAGEFATLVGFAFEPHAPQRGERLRVRLYWKAKHAAAQRYTVFVQLVGPRNPTTNAPLWAQDDKQPGGGTYPTTRWQRGEMIVEDYVFQVPPEARPGEYKIQAGMYLLETGERVPLSAQDRRLPEDAVILQTFELP